MDIINVSLVEGHMNEETNEWEEGNEEGEGESEDDYKDEFDISSSK